MKTYAYIGILLLGLALVMSGCIEKVPANPTSTNNPNNSIPSPSINTNTPSPSFTQMPVGYPDSKWIEILPIQCGQNPWEIGTETMRFASKEAQIKYYYENNGITVHEIKIEIISDVVCEACSCSNGEKISLLVPKSKISQIDKRGFVISEYIQLNVSSAVKCGFIGNNSKGIAEIYKNQDGTYKITAKLERMCQKWSAYWKITNEQVEVIIQGEQADIACVRCVGYDEIETTLDLRMISRVIPSKIVVIYQDEIIGEFENIGSFCGGIASFQCPGGYECKLDGPYPDAGGKCQLPVEKMTAKVLAANFMNYLNKKVIVTGKTIIPGGMTYCTLMACSEQNPCCNSCGAKLALDAGNLKAIEIKDSEGKEINCQGNECKITCQPLLEGKNYEITGTIRQDGGFYLEMESYKLLD